MTWFFIGYAVTLLLICAFELGIRYVNASK